MAVVSSLIVGLLAVPNLSSATDQDGNRRHSLLNAELRSKIERLRDKIEDHRERHHNNQGGSAGSLQALQTEVANLKTALADMVNHQASLLAQLTTANARLSALEKNGTGGNPTDPVLVELIKYVKVDTNPVNGLKGPHVIFHHANVHVQSGSGTTAESNAPTGLGNLIVGYNEMPVSQGWSRAGSHNLVVGPSHTFSSTGAESSSEIAT